jgi:hypothetical protein
MGWHYKPPQSFPAQFFAAAREAIKQPGERVLLSRQQERGDVEAIADNFRYFKWCVKQRPDAQQEIYMLLEAYNLRTKIEDELGFNLWLTATPNTIAEFTRLNPELAASILPHCQ